MLKLGIRNSRRTQGFRRGFTLIEVMIVIAIVLALSTLVGVAMMNRRKDAQRDLAKTDLQTIASAIKFFELDFDRYPTDEEGVKVLWDKSALVTEGNDESKWRGYLEKPMPNDRWGNAWGYRQVSEHGDETKYDLWSFGPDKQEGTDDDITSWATGEAGESGEDLPPPP